MGRKRTWPLPAIAAAALIAGACTTGATTALWGSAGEASRAVVTSGNLEVTPKDLVWIETSSDVAAKQESIDPATFLVRKGDTLQARYRFDLERQGDNMIAEAKLTWPEDLELPDGVTATYKASYDDLMILMSGPVTVGTPTFRNPVLTSENPSKIFFVVIDVNFDGIDDRTVDMSEVHQRVLNDIGSFELEMNQVRR